MTLSLEDLRAQGAISSLDGHFARSMSRVGGDDRPEVLLAAALASRQVAQGDVCVDLRALAASGDEAGWPAFDGWLAALGESPLVGTSQGGVTPLVLDADGRLYLRRLFEDEWRVARDLGRRADAPPLGLSDAAATRASIERLLPLGDTAASEIHWPRVAAAVAIAKRLCVISGRPGTGKTTTAARLLAVLVERALRTSGSAPRIALAAPTGKAAARLAHAIAGQAREMDCAEAVSDAIPGQASTLHRLIGVDARGRLRRDAGARLRADIVLIDEASMVDLALMSRLVAALPESATLILLGDADQLASVEAGSVFADLCGPRRAPEYGSDMAAWIAGATGQSAWASQTPGPGIADCVVRLEKSYRYDEQSGIGELARAIQAGDADAALAVLEDPGRPDVTRVAHSADAAERLRSEIEAGYGPFATASNTGERLQALDRFRVLCAVREGPFGVVALSQLADQTLVRAGRLPARGHAPAITAEGRPILVTRNAPHLGLYNGDVGVLARAADRAGVRAFFESPAASGASELRSFASARLPAHELVFAMSVHKSQGSEFDEVVFVLPPAVQGEPLPLLTRELAYTAVTRARRRVVVYGGASVVRATIERRVQRASGLRDALWRRG